MSSRVVVWDLQDDPGPTRGDVLGWQSYRHAESVFSVPRYLEEHADHIRARYLAFIHDLGEARVAGKRIVDHLDLGDGSSYWWLTQVAEKSPLKSPRIYDCLRVLCLEEILLQRSPEHVNLVSSDLVLAKTIEKLCENLGIGFSFEPHAAAVRWSALAVYDALPFPLRALLSLRHVVARWALRRVRPPQWSSGRGSLFICSYFIHLDPDLRAQGEFHSRQWEALPKFLQARGVRINWLQHFLFSTAVPTVSRGVEWLSGLNARPAADGRHVFLDSYLSASRLVAALKIWLRLNLIAWRLRGIHTVFRPEGSAAWLWLLLRADWGSSITGPIALNNCISLVLFDAAMADLPRQEMGLYLCENQPWEKALLRSWRSCGHGEIVGVQHATAPFWHLYYFDDVRSLGSQPGSLPLPDRLAVNGSDARRAFTAAGFPPEKLVEVEALRYLHLRREPTPEVRAAVAPRARRVLILGDIVPASMSYLLELLQAAAPLLPAACVFTLKPHPGYAPDLARYPHLHVSETCAALGEICGEYDVAVAANSTSAAVDVFVAGLPVVIALDGDSLNLSPLRARRGVRFVSNAGELAVALQTADGNDKQAEREDFFFMDGELPRWQRLLRPLLMS